MPDQDVLLEPNLEFINDAAQHSFTFIDPPFQLNAADVALYPPEVSGHHLLRSMTRRLGHVNDYNPLYNPGGNPAED
jgi:hypothetical protein